VAAGIDHDHQRRADGQRGQVAGGTRFNDRHANGEHQKECADEFNEIFFHKRHKHS
jgi:hypothetical protein